MAEVLSCHSPSLTSKSTQKRITHHAFSHPASVRKLELVRRLAIRKAAKA
jgi:hypothetical protein